MKVRVKWTKTGVLKFIGHLDVQRYFQKALMRAELPVSFSKGMSPHQIMSFAAPLGLGMTSEGEYADISFDWTYSSEEMLSRINAVMNEGISVLEFKEIDEKEKNCIRNGETVCCYTTRSLITADTGDKEDELRLSVRISDAVQSLVGRLHETIQGGRR